MTVEDIFEGMQALMSNVPYNTLQVATLSNLKHDWLSRQHMSHFVEFLSAVMDWERMGNFSALLFSSKRGMNCYCVTLRIL